MYKEKMVAQILVFIFGSMVGSFLNVCIYRLPLEKSVVMPRSFCPHCKHTIFWYDNIPFASYLFLKAKCRFCKERISFRYFLVELVTAVLFLVFFNRYGLSFDFLFYLVFASGLIIATFIDLKHRIIPDEISLGGIAAGLLFNLVRPALLPLKYSLLPIWDALLGALLGAGIIYSIGFLFDLVYFKILKKPAVEGETTSMGGGDVKLLAMIGAFLGWQKAILVFFIAPFFAVVVGVINLLVKKEHLIPYGPFLSLAAILSIFWADKIIRVILMR